MTGAARPDRLAVTKALTAIDPDQPELAAARDAGIPVEAWQQVVADAAVGRTLVGVAGTHGKSTTSGWLVHVLVPPRAPTHRRSSGALLPSSITGGPPATARWGSGDAFVVEADEYAGNFDAYHPALAILTSAEWDHPDVFADRAAVEATFESWLRRAPRGATVVANVGDPGVEAVLDRLDRLARHDPRLRARRPGATTAGRLRPRDRRAVFDRERPGHGAARPGDRQRPGEHDPGAPRPRPAGRPDRRPGSRPRAATTRRTPWPSRAAASVLGLTPDVIATHLATFAGIGRRLERKGEASGVVVYDDYGHHPTAIRETLAAVRQREPGRRVWAVYEPLTFHRTAAMLAQFADVLSSADAVAIADVWAGRDPDTTIASAADLAAAIQARRPGLPVLAPGSVDATADRLAEEVRAGDVVLVMGGGASYRIGERLLSRLEVTR